VLDLLNNAHAEAERLRSSEVDLVHLMIALATNRTFSDLFDAARIDRRILLAIVEAEAARSVAPQSAQSFAKPATSRDVRLLLELAERTAAIYGSRIMSIQDLAVTMFALPGTLDGAKDLRRWLWASRVEPALDRLSGRGRADGEWSRAHGMQQASTPMDHVTPLTGSTEIPVDSSLLPAATATSAASATGISSTATVSDSKVVRLKSRGAATAPDDLIEDEPGESDQDPDPELEKLGVKRYYLSLDDDIVRAPSIGPRTAERLQPHGVTHVKHLLACDPERLSARLGARHLTASRIAAWKNQARLVCTIPWLRGMHAQLLVGAGYASIEKILSSDRSQVCAAVMQFATTRDGQSILRGASPPELDRIMHWIENSQLAEPQRAQWGKVASAN
jgi:hypothetical protein